MARTKQKGRGGTAKAKKPAKKQAAKKSTKSSDADPPAHANELKIQRGTYDRCDRERFDLSTKGTSFEHLTTKPPGFRRGRQITYLPVSKDGWAPDHLKKPEGFPGTWKQLCENWAREFPHLLPKCEAGCVWGEKGKGWTPAKRQPSWWRLDYHEDDTYRVLCFCFSRNFRCYQPVLGVDFSEFCTHALKGDATAKKLMAINEDLKKIGQPDWDAKHKKPAKCDDRCPL